MRSLIPLALLLLWGCSATPTPPAPAALPRTGESISARQDDPELNEAIAKARAGLDAFIGRLQNPRRGEVFSVEVDRKTPSGGHEHIWIGNVSFKDGVFAGTVDSTPKRALDLKQGDAITAKRDEVTDWMILHSGKSEGGFTTEILMRRQATAPGAR